MNATLPPLVWDFDGTLADTGQDIALALNRAFAEVDRPQLSEAEVLRYVGDGVSDLVRKALPDEQPSAALISDVVRLFRKHYDEVFLHHTELYDGVVECLQACQGHALVVASNKPENFLRRMVHGLGLQDHFLALVGGDTVGITKPDPKVLQHVAQLLGCTPEKLWMIGDTEVDIRAAKAVGAHSIGCTWGFRKAEVLREAGAEHLADHPQAVRDIIRSV